MYGKIRRVAELSREEHIIRDKVIIRSVVEVLKEKAFEGMRLRELADLLIDYWNAVSDMHAAAFENPSPYTLLGPSGVFSLHKLFPSVYARCARSGVINEEGMREVLALLMMETTGYPDPDFRRPLTLDFWSRDHGPMIAISTNRNIINDLYRHLQTKIQLAEAG